MAPHPIFPPSIATAVLPPWTNAVAAGPSVLDQIALPAGHILLLPIHDALPVSVDALFVGPQDMPQGNSDFGRMLQALKPGGAALLAIPRGRFARRELETLLAASGLRTSDALSSQSTAVARIVVVENPGGLTERPPLRLSVVLTGDFAESQPLQERVVQWADFLRTEFRCDGTEILAVRDCPADPLGEVLNEEPSYREVQHYRSFGPATAAMTGMRFARGRFVLVDGAGGGVPPSSFLDLLLPMLTGGEHRPSLVVPLQTESKRSSYPNTPPFQGGSRAAPAFRRWHNAVRRQLLGAAEPRTDFFLADFSVARAAQPKPLHRSRGTGRNLLVPRVRRSNLCEVALRRVRPGPQQPGLLRSLWLRLRLG